MSLVGVVGDDEGGTLREILLASGVDVSGVFVDGSRPTTGKKLESGHHIGARVVR